MSPARSVVVLKLDVLPPAVLAVLQVLGSHHPVSTLIILEPLSQFVMLFVQNFIFPVGFLELRLHFVVHFLPVVLVLRELFSLLVSLDPNSVSIGLEFLVVLVQLFVLVLPELLFF